MDLGRFQPGPSVTIGLSTVNAAQSPAMPDAAPIATIVNASSVTIWTGKIALTPTPFLFSLPIFLGIAYPVGTYQVSYSWDVLGVPVTASDQFEVIAGGDIGGRVISMYAYVRPEATYVVGQLTSGTIVQGRNPRLPSAQ